MRLLMISACLVLPLFVPSASRAQNDESNLPPTNYGAGYKIVIFSEHQEHDPGPNDDPDGQGPVKLDITYPQISTPLTSNAFSFNATMKRMVSKWWQAMGAPIDNKQSSDPNIDYLLDCEPVGLPPPVDARSPPNARMVAGVISIACESYIFYLGAAHGGGRYWGFNWILNQRRTVRADDVFNMNLNWLTSLSGLVDADRGSPVTSLQTLDFSDTTHWVISSQGLRIIYSYSEFSGFESGGRGTLDFMPWSELAPYLRRGGIVPKADWSATLPQQ